MSRGKQEDAYEPITWAEVKALGEQIRSDRGCVIECHLFEAKAKNEEKSAERIHVPRERAERQDSES
jgi:hypothetical protein